MQIEVETYRLMDGRYNAGAILRNPKITRAGKPMVIRETCEVRQSASVAKAIAIVDLMLATLPQ